MLELSLNTPKLFLPTSKQTRIQKDCERAGKRQEGEGLQVQLQGLQGQPNPWQPNSEAAYYSILIILLFHVADYSMRNPPPTSHEMKNTID